jgi:glycosyltransferase involved in cell wall biosynthesis
MKKKILIVTSGFPLWETEGLNVFMLEFARTLAKDFEVFVLAPLSKRSKPFEKMGDITVYRHKQFPIFNAELAYRSGIAGNIKNNPMLLFAVPFYFLLQLFAIRRIVKKHGIEIINSHWIIPQGIAVTLYKLFFNSPVKIISTIHGSDLLALNNFLFNPAKKWVLKNSECVVVVSPLLKAEAEKYVAKKISVLPMGINTNKFSPEKKRENLKQKLNVSGRFILFVGGLVEGKGIRYLVQSMKFVVQKFSDAKLMAVGEGYMKAELLAMVNEMHLQNNILFKDIIPNDELPEYFASADVFVLPSLTEGYSLVLREALSCETPSLVANIPVFAQDEKLRDIVFFCEQKNSESIAEKISFMLENIFSEEMKRRRKAGREYVRQTGEWKVTGAAYAEIINSF